VIRRKPVKKEHEGAVTLVGMILILLLAGYVLFHDISKLF
jgi:membrane-associated protease RseP (regulator of RpoE activity)